MTTLEKLTAARASITDPRDWWQEGMETPTSGGCAHIALSDVEDDWPSPGSAHAVLMRVIGAHTLRDVFNFNDTHTHAEVLAAFDEASKIEEAREAEMSVVDVVATGNPDIRGTATDWERNGHTGHLGAIAALDAYLGIADTPFSVRDYVNLNDEGVSFRKIAAQVRADHGLPPQPALNLVR